MYKRAYNVTYNQEIYNYINKLLTLSSNSNYSKARFLKFIFDMIQGKQISHTHFLYILQDFICGSSYRGKYVLIGLGKKSIAGNVIIPINQTLYYVKDYERRRNDNIIILNICSMF